MARTPSDFGELRNDTKFINAITGFDASLNKIEETLATAVDFKNYDELPPREKVKMDNYMAYTVNSLYWMYVKLRGMDPNQHGIKNELGRVRQAISREQQVHDYSTIRPVLDKAAAGRFIKHGLQVRSTKLESDDEKNYEE